MRCSNLRLRRLAASSAIPVRGHLRNGTCPLLRTAKLHSSLQLAAPLAKPATIHVQVAQLATCSHTSCRGRRRVLVKAAAGKSAEEEIQVVQSSLPGCAVKLTVTVTPSFNRKCYKRTLDRLRKIVGEVRGFPKNKPLPDGIVASAVGGERKFKLAIIEDILYSSFETVMPRYNTVMVPNSDEILTKAEELAEALILDQPVTYDIKFEVMPTVKWRKPYQNIEVVIQDTGTAETDDKAAADLIRQYQKNKGYQKIVQGRGLAASDIAVIDMDIRTAGSPTPLPGMKKDMFMFDTEVDPLGLLPHVEGMELGEQRSFKLHFPEDWHAEMLRGAEAQGRVKLHELFTWVLPEFNDEFVSKYYPEYPGAAAMRAAIVQATALERFKQRDADLQEAFYKELLACVDVEVPERLVVDMGYNEYQTNLMQMVAKGETRVEDLQSLATEQMADEYVKSSRGRLVELVKIVLASEEIARAEGIGVEEEEVKAELEVACREFESQQLEYDVEKLREQVEEQLKGLKVLEWVKDTCKITILPPPGSSTTLEPEPAAA